MSLVAKTRRVDESVDLLALGARPGGVLFERGQAGLAGRGEALRLRWPEGDPTAAARQVAEALAQVEVDDEVGLPGCGPVAFGALPFTPGAPAELIVPQVVVGRSEDGARWVTVIGEDPGDDAFERNLSELGSPPDSSRGAGLGQQPRRFTVEAAQAPEAWCALVDRATKALVEAGDRFTKVVLARDVIVTADQPFDVRALLERLRAAYPECHIVSVDGLVAASPELLVSRSGDVVRSHPMAGTAPRGGDPTTDQRLAASLLASAKDREEHQITIDMVQDTLLGWCSYVDYEAEPSVVAMANVQHLATLVEARLSHPPPSVLELVAALHPTPAVAGWPRDRAVEWIAANEELDRHRYAGTVGWADARGNGTWAVSVRCAELDGAKAHVYAGNGIVAGSDPEVELAETRAKLQALLSALCRP